MSTALKLTITRIVLLVLIILFLLFPFDTAGISMPKLFINELLVVDIKYLIAGVLFLFAVLTVLLFNINTKKSVSNKDKLLSEVSNKVLINSTLVTLSSQGFINPIIPVILIIRDTIMSSFKTNFEIKRIIQKIQDTFLILGITLTLFYNLPFELIGHGVDIATVLLLVATVLSVYSGIQYYSLNKDLLFKEK